ncbi:endonuclease I [Mycoplasmopsis mustelae]|uniref:Endonuclease I n=1 Tax=Mycoplasmopsis mustelae TaxID=171289 RepID=A0A4R7UEJ9_9BACT|nr:endonuclease [Mycoplasmopsis mustelae]TDV24506.1 endonuclease I [Mycoplasmopsis mustelae]
MKLIKKLAIFASVIPFSIAISCNQQTQKNIKNNKPKEQITNPTNKDTELKKDNTNTQNPVESTSSMNLETSKNNNRNWIYQKSDYYNNAEGKTGRDLWRALETHHHGIRASILHGSQIYESLKNFYNTSKAYKDYYYKKDGGILDIFTTQSNDLSFVSKTQFNENTSANAESQELIRGHLVPEKWYSSLDPMQPDPFTTWPLDTFINKKRANYPIGEVVNPTYNSRNGSKLGLNISGQNVFEIVDAFKGDVARSLMYFVTMYYEKSIYNDPNNNSFIPEFPYYKTDFLNTYIKWNKIDPVDAFDINRNNEIYKVYKFRNPFIDYPNLVESLFGENPKPFINKGILISNGSDEIFK